MDLVLAADQASSSSGGGSSNLLLLGMGALVVAALYFANRKSRKVAQERAQLRSALGEGMLVMTASGYVGTIVATEGDLITLESEDGHTTTWVKEAILREYVPVTADDIDDDEDELDDEELDEDLDDEADELDAESIEIPDDLSSLDTPDDPDKPTKNA